MKISDEEVDFLFGLGVEEGAAYILENFGVKLVFVTCGADGCFFKNAVAEGHVPSLSGIQVIDTPAPVTSSAAAPSGSCCRSARRPRPLMKTSCWMR